MPSDGAPDPAVLETLGRRLLELDLSFDPVADRLRRRCARLATEYLAPRLRRPHDPAVVVVVGPSGAGRSALADALTGAHRADPGVANAAVEGAGRGGLSVIDAPSPDLVDDVGDPVAHCLLDAADACVLVVSATRYGDASAFALAEHARRIGVPVLVVANLLPAEQEAGESIVVDLTAKLDDRGFGDDAEAPVVITLPEGNDDLRPGEISSDVVAPIRERLQAWPGDRTVRVQRSMDELQRLLEALRSQLQGREERRSMLRSIVEGGYRRQVDALMAEVRSGRFMADDPGEALRALATAIARHAGRAATAVADLWAETAPDLVTDELYGASDGALVAARSAVDRWVRSAPMRRFSPSAMLVGGRRLWLRFALHAKPRLSRAESRWVQRRPGFAEASRRRLHEAAAAALTTDSERFTSRLGPAISEETITGLSLEVTS